jgi:glucose-6-phosphate 1-dehydrogenase
MAQDRAAKNAPPPAPPCVLVLFGARGDLAKRLLVPALYNLARARLLDDRFTVLGVDRDDCGEAVFRRDLADFITALAADKNSEFGNAPIDKGSWDWLESRLGYLAGDFENEATYAALSMALARPAGEGAMGVLFYLAVAPGFFGDIVKRLGKAGLTRESGGFRRVVIEKPFGHDLASAKALNRQILKVLAENQIYRIDHFLGKETVRNILVARFGNGVFEPLWNRFHIDHVQITAAETIGVEKRGAYYDRTGALRDMVPNHLFQLLGLTAMEPPNSFAAEDVRAEKTRAIEAVVRQSRAEALENAVRGQYRAGTAGGRRLGPYRGAPDVSPGSSTETYVALKLTIDNWRWSGVPFYLRTGKAMSVRDTEISIQFKAAPVALFKGAAAPNVLALQIQPDEGISLDFLAKQPGPEVRLAPVRMNFRYVDVFGAKPSTGYETLIYDCLIGDQTLFKRADDIEFAWRAVMPFLEAWKSGGQVHTYAAGSDGPHAAEELLAREGRRWRPLGQ